VWLLEQFLKNIKCPWVQLELHGAAEPIQPPQTSVKSVKAEILV